MKVAASLSGGKNGYFAVYKVFKHGFVVLNFLAQITCLNRGKGKLPRICASFSVTEAVLVWMHLGFDIRVRDSVQGELYGVYNRFDG